MLCPPGVYVRKIRRRPAPRGSCALKGLRCNPGLCFEAIFDGRAGHVGGGGGHCRNTDAGDDLEDLNARIACRREAFDFSFGHVALLFDQRFGEGGERSVLRVCRQFSCADGIDVGFGHAVFEGKGGVRRHGPWAFDRDRVGKQQGLLFALVEAAAVEAAETSCEAVQKNRVGGHGGHDIG